MVINGIDINLLLFYVDTLCDVLDGEAEAFSKRIACLLQKDLGGAEFLNRMYLKPLTYQEKYLLRNINYLFKKGKNENEHEDVTKF